MGDAEFTGKSSSSTSSAHSSARPQAAQAGEASKHSAHLTYMHRPPRIMPNLGRKPRGTLPKSNVSRVLLYDNVTQQQMLDVKISHLRAEKRKAGHLLDMHRKSFFARRQRKQKCAADTGMRDTCHVLQHKQLQLSVAEKKSFTPSPGADGSSLEGKEVLPRIRQVVAADGAEDKIWQHPCVGKVDKEDETAVLRKGDSASFAFPSHSAGSRQRRASGRDDVQKTPDAGHHTIQGNQSTKTSPGVLPPGAESGTVKLPAISSPFPSASGGTTSTGKAALSIGSNRQGVTRLLHTFHEAVDHNREKKLAKDATKTGGDTELFLSMKTVNDDRYQRLERLLVKLDRPSEGYPRLSPSFHLVCQAVHSGHRPSSHLNRLSTEVPSPGLTALVSPL